MLRSPSVRQLFSRPNLRPTVVSKTHITPIPRAHSRPLFNSGPSQSALYTRLPVYTLIGICCGGYGLNYYAEQQAMHRDRRLKDILVNYFTCSLDNIRSGRPYTMLTASLMHFNPWHLFFNMYALSSIGPAVIQYYGLRSFVALWAGGSVSCFAWQMFWDGFKEDGIAWWEQLKGTWTGTKYSSRPPIPSSSEDSLALGASGSLFSMLAALCWDFPQMRMTMLPIPLPIPAWILGIAFAGGSFYCCVEQIFPIIGHAGHLGGIAFGGIFFAAKKLSALRSLRRLRRF